MSYYDDPGRAAAAVARFKALAGVVPPLAALLASGAYDDDMILAELKGGESSLESYLGYLLTPALCVAVETPPELLASWTRPGERVVREPGYDYDPTRNDGNAWGAINLRAAPLSEVLDYRIITNAQTIVLPASWMRPTYTTSVLRVLPNGTGQPVFLAGVYGSAASSFGVAGGATFGLNLRLPNAVRIAYRAGIKDLATEYPGLALFIPTFAVAMLLQALVPAGSTSISADGLSQSRTFDLGAWLNGSDGKGGVMGMAGSWKDRLRGPLLGMA